MLSLMVVVKLCGGFWVVRERFATAHGWRRSLWGTLYTRYLESLGSYIAIEARIAEPIWFPHKPTGVFIAPGAVVGRGCVMYQQAALATVDTVASRNRGVPIIGDNVLIGAGARVVGAVKIGNDVRLGVGVTVAENVPDGATVVCPPMRVIVRGDDGSPLASTSVMGRSWMRRLPPNQ